MFGNLAVRAIIPASLAVTGFVVVCCFLLYGFIKEDITKDTINHETSLADTVIKSTRYSMLKADQEGMHSIIANIGSQEGVEHIRIFNRKGVILYSNDKTELNNTVDKDSAGCKGCHAGNVPLTSLGKMDQARRFVNKKGVPVIAITSPIYNEPACASAECHIHPDTQKVLGTLDIGLSAMPLNQTLSVISSRMIIFCLMVLLLTIGGVAAILRRAVFLPLRSLLVYTSKRTRDFPKQEHPGQGCELKDLEYNFKLMEERLQAALDTPSSGKGGKMS